MYMKVYELLSQWPVLRRVGQTSVRQWVSYAPRLIKYFKENRGVGDRYRIKEEEWESVEEKKE
jgi:hypothetical protein